MASKSAVDSEEFAKRGYNLVKALSKGSFSKVYKAIYTDTRNGTVKTLACKIVNLETISPGFRTKFLPRELDVLLRVDHPYIIRTFSIYRIHNAFYFFMPYIESGDLFQLVHRNERPITENMVRVWTYQIALALQYLHTLEIGHRDLKCENILITERLNVRLVDFGFSRMLLDDNCRHEVMCKTFCGSLQYAAPEVVKSEPYSAKMADVWSFGIVLLVVFNRSMPFMQQNTRTLYTAQINEKWQFNKSVENLLSKECKDLIKVNLNLTFTWMAIKLLKTFVEKKIVFFFLHFMAIQ